MLYGCFVVTHAVWLFRGHVCCMVVSWSRMMYGFLVVTYAVWLFGGHV